MDITFIFSIAILILSVVVHEVAHGYAAETLGDPTARLAGRLTLNPIQHLDMIGSFVVPAVSLMLGGFIIGWAKPVPYNPYNLNHKYGDALVAVAGPFSNLLLALIFGVLIRINEIYHFLSEQALSLMVMIVFINLILMVFNLIPIPPLDSSKILSSLLSNRYLELMQRVERYWLLIIIFYVFFLWQFVLPVVGFLFSLITGLAF